MQEIQRSKKNGTRPGSKQLPKYCKVDKLEPSLKI